MRGNVVPLGILLGTLISTTLVAVQTAPVYQVVVDVDPVAVDVAVTDRQGRSVANLTRNDFIILEDGQPQELRSADLVGLPYSILLLVDRSPREEKSDWPKFVVKSVDLFLKNLRGPDRLAVAGFDDRVSVLVDWRPSKNGIVQKVMLRKSLQPTQFFEAVNWASEEMQYAPTTKTPAQPHLNGRKGVIVFTDGRDHEMYPKYQIVDGRNVPDPGYEVPPVADAQFEKARQVLQEGTVPF